MRKKGNIKMQCEEVIKRIERISELNYHFESGLNYPSDVNELSSISDFIEFIENVLFFMEDTTDRYEKKEAEYKSNYNKIKYLLKTIK